MEGSGRYKTRHQEFIRSTWGYVVKEGITTGGAEESVCGVRVRMTFGKLCAICLKTGLNEKSVSSE